MASPRERHRDEQRARLASGIAAYATGANEDDILRETRGDAEAAAARHMAMYLAYVAFGMSYARVAAAFGRDRSTVAYAVRRMEDWRDDAQVDDWFNALERMLQEAPEPNEAPSRRSLA